MLSTNVKCPHFYCQWEAWLVEDWFVELEEDPRLCLPNVIEWQTSNIHLNDCTSDAICSRVPEIIRKDKNIRKDPWEEWKSAFPSWEFNKKLGMFAIFIPIQNNQLSQ